MTTISSIAITAVWAALGGGPLRSGRGKAFWRGGDGFTVSLNDDKGAWYDFRDGRGGGILDLVQTALSCERRAAVEWLACTFDLNIDQPLSLDARRRYAKARSDAELFLKWRAISIDELRDQRDVYLDRYHRALQLIVSRSLNHPMGATWADICELCERRALEAERRLDAFIVASFDKQIPAFRESLQRCA